MSAPVRAPGRVAALGVAAASIAVGAEALRRWCHEHDASDAELVKCMPVNEIVSTPLNTSATDVRPARPTLDEGLAYARYLNEASDGAFRVLLGKCYDRVIAWAYLSPGHDLSYDTAIFAERSGQIAGMACGYTSQQHEQSSDEPLRSAAGYRMMRMAALALLGGRTKRFIKTVPDGDYYVLAIAVDDDHRGAGIGTALLDYCEARARDAGCTRIVLDVVEKNDGARRLYERRGMYVEAMSPRMILVPNSRACRMVKPL